MPESRRIQIAQAVEAALNTPSVGSIGRPGGLSVHRDRLRPTTDDDLPAQVVYVLDDRVVDEDATGVLIRRVRFGVESRVAVPDTVAADDAVDALVVWAVVAVMAEETFGGLAHMTIEQSTDFIFEEGTDLLGRAATVFEIQYQTARENPTIGS